MAVVKKVPLNTRVNETWFSLMNRLKSKWRNRMSRQLLQDLMFICCHGSEDLAKVDFEAALAKWKDLSERGRYLGTWKEDLTLVAQDMQKEAKLRSW